MFVHLDHLCFDQITYDDINGPGGPSMFDIIGLARPLMYLDQIFCDRTNNIELSMLILDFMVKCRLKNTQWCFCESMECLNEDA